MTDESLKNCCKFNYDKCLWCFVLVQINLRGIIRKIQNYGKRKFEEVGYSRKNCCESDMTYLNDKELDNEGLKY